MTPLLTIVGKSNSGKTTLLTRLIPEIKKRGYRIGTIKHAHHGFDMDHEGKDSYLHKKAGAETVLVSSPGKIAMIKDDDNESLSDLEHYLSDMDIIICEGFKKESKPKIEIFRKDIHKTPLCDDENLIAMVTDSDHNFEVPIFGLDEIEGIADFIIQKFLK
ncbi:MAG: molybdopterin-guanine dinucleotide biosynthesis protein B [Deltaproteobacteria bacterium]|nr:molybdopterin-guanine dinucleotide biosynthesis protein B [Deltaproteobacteria bacterium]